MAFTKIRALMTKLSDNFPFLGTVTGTTVADNSITNAKFASTIAASNFSGALPAIDGSALTGLSATTTSSSDPLVTTNGTLGDVFINTTSGETYICTDATTDNNVWTNVGAGTTDVVPYDWGGTSYGYVVGGYSAYFGIDRFALSSGTNNVVVGASFTQAQMGNWPTYSYHAMGGSSSDTHLYGAGGQGGHAGNHIRTMVSKVQMAASTSITDHHDLDLPIGSARSVNNRTHAYHLGGEGFSENTSYHGTTFGQADYIQKTTYATDVSSTQTTTLDTATSDGGSVSGPTAGYKNGIRAQTSGKLQKYVYATDVASTCVATLTYNQGDRTQSHASETYGYAAGGNGSDVINSWSFSNEATQTDVGNLASGLDYAQACSSTTHGYTMGGTGTGNSQRIQRYSFASQAENSSQTSLSGSSWGQGGLSNGQE
jgi:hypothetical protein